MVAATSGKGAMVEARQSRPLNVVFLDTIESSVVLRRPGRKKGGGNTKLLPEIAKNGKNDHGKMPTENR